MAPRSRWWPTRASAVDAPLLHPSFVRAVLAALDAGVDAAVPETGGRVHPLAAAYRVSLLALTQHLRANDQLAMRALLDHCRVRYLPATELPAPESLTNVNSRADYERTRGEVLHGRAAVTPNGEPTDPDPELPLVASDHVTLNWNTT